ncbi:MAG: SprT family zinc-dependent metalloprotease [Sulfitobacter sp.]|nr:SprT family zinc-dependent metalloprotease [Sulfitobacter sp.]
MSSAQPYLPGDPPIPLTLRRSARARRISLRISQLDGRVTLTLPRHLPEADALAFAREKESWIRKHLETRQEDVAVSLGASLPVEGLLRQIVPGRGQRIVIGPQEVAVPGEAARVGARLGAHLKALARERLAEASDRHATRLGRPYARITLRDTRSRWGSCTSDGGLMYSWRLILAPPEVLDYVAAHEVAHLAEMNHSAAFWAKVETLFGDHAGPRRWLRQEGTALHRYKF